MKWILSLLFVLMFGFCGEAQMTKSIDENITIKLKHDKKNYLLVFTLRDEKKPNRKFCIKYYTNVNFARDTVYHVWPSNKPLFTECLDSAGAFTLQMKSDTTFLEFRDIFYSEPNSKINKKLNKKLLITLVDTIPVKYIILPDYSENKINNLARPEGQWIFEVKHNTFHYKEFGAFKNDQKFSVWEYHTNGKLKSSINYVSNYDYESTEFYNNGNKNIVAEYKNSYKNGFYKEFYPNGKIRIESNYDNDYFKGLYIEFYENGSIKNKGLLFKLKTFCDSPSAHIKHNENDPYAFLDSTVCVYESVKDGKWEYFSENGKLIRKEIYEQGKLMRKEDY